MKDRILREPAFCLGLVVWVVAVTVFPLQLGLGRANLAAFAAYVAIAGVLLAAAEAMRSEGWTTVAALDEACDAAALGCSHELGPGGAEPI